MKKILLYLWQIPQNILGLLLVLYFRGEKCTSNGVTYWHSRGILGGISLGDYIIVNTHNTVVIRHEYGHSIQSVRLGWLYLVVVGLPSLLWNIFHGERDYYSFYTEKWADKLGGVKR